MAPMDRDNRRGKRVLVLLLGEVLDDPRVLKTCRSLTADGAVVTVACTNPAHRSQAETVDGIAIVRFPHYRDFALKRFYGWLRKNMGAAAGTALAAVHEGTSPSRSAAMMRRIVLAMNFNHYITCAHRINRAMTSVFCREVFDLVHSNDVDTLWAGRDLVMCGAARELLYDAHEYWPGMNTDGSRANDVLRELETEGIAWAAHVVTVNPLIARRMHEEYGLDAEPAVVMNCPRKKPLLTDGAGVHDPVRVVYQGKFQAYRGLEKLVLAFRDIDNATLTMSGYGPLEEGLRRLAAQEGLDGRVHFTGRYTPDEALTLLAGHDIGVITTEAVVRNNIYSSPNKLFDYAMAGCVVATSGLPFIAETAGRFEFGVTFPTVEPDAIATTITALAADAERCASMKANARKAAMTALCWEEQFARYPWRG